MEKNLSNVTEVVVHNDSAVSHSYRAFKLLLAHCFGFVAPQLLSYHACF